MESQRSFFIIGLLLMTVLLWQQWQIDFGPQPETVEAAPTTQVVGQPSQATANVGNDDVPETVLDTSSQNKLVGAQTITITTDVIEAVINLKGGDIVSLKLLQYPLEKDSEQSFELLKNQSDHIYHAQSGLIGLDGPDASRQGRPLYQVSQSEFVMDGDTLAVPLSFTNALGLTVTKVFTFQPGRYDVQLDFNVANNTQTIRSVQPYGQLKQSTSVSGGSMFMPTYRGAAYSTVNEAYEKIDFDDIYDNDLNTASKGGWVAMIEHYFVSAWVPSQNDVNEYSTKTISGGLGLIRFKGPIVELEPGEKQTLTAILYAGPKDQSELDQLAENLKLTVDYGMLWFFSEPLFWLLEFLYSFVGNWGVAIILITLVVKTLLYPLTKKQYTSMAKLRVLQPKMMQLKERHGEDRQKMSMAMMELYKKEKVNPMGGCLPLLLQMPIFLALYWVFVESVELRHAEFALWLTDLSQKDPYFVLPVLMGASMFLMQKLQPTPVQDPVQQKMFQFMPIIFTFFFLTFPAGLVLYWLISNVVSIAQIWMINKAIEKQGLNKKAKE